MENKITKETIAEILTDSLNKNNLVIVSKFQYEALKDQSECIEAQNAHIKVQTETIKQLSKTLQTKSEALKVAEEALEKAIDVPCPLDDIRKIYLDTDKKPCEICTIKKNCYGRTINEALQKIKNL